MGRFTLLSVYISPLFLLCSCYSPSLMVDDDVYLVKATEIPVGESQNDETSYANFKSRKEGTALSSSFYNDDPLFMSRHHFHHDIWYFGMGYGNPYYRPMSWGNGHWGIPYYSPYMYGYLNPLYMYDPFGSPYGFCPTAYTPWYLGGIYGYPGVYNGFPSNSEYQILTNHHSGPRSTVSGFGDPNRITGNTIKSLQHTPSPLQPETTNRQMRVGNDQIIGQREISSVNRNQLRSVSSTASELRPVANRGIQSPGSNNAPSGITVNQPVRTGQPGARSNDHYRPSGSNGNIRISSPGNGQGRPGNRSISAPVRRP